MNIIPEQNLTQVRRTEIEQVQKEKHEYKMLGTYLRTRGLKLFAYNPVTKQLKEVVIKRSKNN